MTSADSWENAVALAVSVCVVLTAAAAAAAAAASPAASMNASDTTVAMTSPAAKADARGASRRSTSTSVRVCGSGGASGMTRHSACSVFWISRTSLPSGKGRISRSTGTSSVASVVRLVRWICLIAGVSAKTRMAMPSGISRPSSTRTSLGLDSSRFR